MKQHGKPQYRETILQAPRGCELRTNLSGILVIGSIASQFESNRMSHRSGGAILDPEVLLVLHPAILDATPKIAHKKNNRI